jgi:uncharacterized membrane protein YqgA involved in biofilm formation
MLTGSILNGAGVLIGGALGLSLAGQLSANTQVAVRGLSGVITAALGLSLVWLGIRGNFGHLVHVVVVALLGIMFGKWLGHLSRIQKNLNQVGQFASRRFAEVRPEDPHRINDGFIVCTLLFCAGPLGLTGAVVDGLGEHWEPLAVKMVMDGLAAMGFARVFGWGVLFSTIPVIAFEGTIAQACHRIEPWLTAHSLIDPIYTVAGLIICCVALVILELKRVELADYLPSLIVAPFIASLWH